MSVLYLFDNILYLKKGKRLFEKGKRLIFILRSGQEGSERYHRFVDPGQPPETRVTSLLGVNHDLDRFVGTALLTACQTDLPSAEPWRTLTPRLQYPKIASKHPLAQMLDL